MVYEGDTKSPSYGEEVNWRFLTCVVRLGTYGR